MNRDKDAETISALKRDAEKRRASWDEEEFEDGFPIELLIIVTAVAILVGTFVLTWVY